MTSSRDEKFRGKHAVHEFDRGLWKQFWFCNQRYHTVCLSCISAKKEAERISHDKHSSSDDWGAVMLDDNSRVILDSWYKNAKQSLFGTSGKSREKFHIDVSDDEGDDWLHDWSKQRLAFDRSSSTMAVYWLRSARSRLQSNKYWDDSRRLDTD